MELDSHSSKQAYIQLLTDTLQRKLTAMQQLAVLTEQQEILIDTELFDEGRFSETIAVKEEQIKLLAQLDNGFEQIYESVRDELLLNKYRYMSEIAALQELITSITDLSIKLQAKEVQNKSNLELLLTQKRKDIKKSRLNSQTVSKYYKSMAQQTQEQSFFYDKKK